MYVLVLARDPMSAHVRLRHTYAPSTQQWPAHRYTPTHNARFLPLPSSRCGMVWIGVCVCVCTFGTKKKERFTATKSRRSDLCLILSLVSITSAAPERPGSLYLSLGSKVHRSDVTSGCPNRSFLDPSSLPFSLSNCSSNFMLTAHGNMLAQIHSTLAPTVPLALGRFRRAFARTGGSNELRPPQGCCEVENHFYTPACLQIECDLPLGLPTKAVYTI